MPFPLQFTCPFVLASGSPRRQALLDHVGISFETHVSPAEETVSGSHSPQAFARILAPRKARPVARNHASALVLAADTVVAHDGDVLGKPEGPAHARRMLRRLSGTAHAVYTACTLAHDESGREITFVATTRVRVAPLSDREIADYVETGSPMDKAGGYGIQDHTAPFFITGMTGDYYTVVGLPLRRVYEALRENFGDLLVTLP